MKGERRINRADDWETIVTSGKTQFNKAEVLHSLGQTAGLLKEWQSELMDTPGAKEVGPLMERHLILYEGLRNGRTVSAEVWRLFPRAQAGEIMEWHTRLSTGLREMERLCRSS